MFKRFMPVFLAVVLGACATCSAQGPAPIPSDVDKCGAACKKLSDMGCQEGQPLDVPSNGSTPCETGSDFVTTDAGMFCRTSCEMFCHSVMVNGRVSLNPSCIIDRVTVCPDIDALCN